MEMLAHKACSLLAILATAMFLLQVMLVNCDAGCDM